MRTQEKGGSKEIYKRLADRDTPVDFPIYCDPDHKLLASPADKIYVKQLQEASKYGGTYEDYMMVQPCVILANQAGGVETWWSWRRMVRDAEPGAMRPVFNPTTGLPVPLVTVRPKSADIVAAAEEGRDFFHVSQPPMKPT